jgi:hypothetical protein
MQRALDPIPGTRLLPHDPEDGIEHEGLDGSGTTSAANLPARTAEGITVWDTTWPQRITEELDMEQTEPIKRERCLMVDPDGDRLMPGRCKRPYDHEPPRDWRAAHGAYLDGGRREQLRERDTPSGVLPVRVPGAAPGDARAESGSADAQDAAGPTESNEREVLETWTA